MDSENVALVRRVYELFNQLDTDPEARRGSTTLTELLELFAEDVAYTQVGGPPDAGSFGDRDSMRAVWEEWLSLWREHRSTIEEIRESGDRVLALTHEWFRPRDGMELENHGAGLFTVRDGLIVRFEGYVEQAAAIAAFEGGVGD